ncbi:hypothetical protein [Phocaeicola coprocola]|jgi:hypothetical protein|uniref:hypothetical protein n=1 Tax=Phocaeicola coprocola TaxID=310298 RepID=UPI0022E1C8E4|nr:hypothetical protein [Phocaeicola coprocola]
MKKNYLLGMALIASLSFYSCDKEVVYVQDGNGVESVADGAQIITLQVENGGDGLATRAGRPLFSAEAKQTIENVKLWICDNTGKKVVYVKEISNWNTDGSTVYTTGGHGRQTTIELKDADKLAAGTYQIYAVGYSATSDYDLTKVTEVKKTEEGEGKYTFSENMVLPIKGDATNKIGEEIFAGQMELTVEQGKGFKKPIVLNRQVAGAFAYVKDIPYMEGAKYLKLVASAQNQSLVLGNFNSFDLTGNGSGNGKNVKYVVNGTNGKSGSDTCVISTIDLNKWFTAIKDEDGDNLIDAGKNWKNPHRPSGSPAAGTYPTFQKGSAFGGEFVIPFAHVDGKQTLTLQLTNAGGKVLRSWKVNLGSTDVQLNQTITYWNSNWDSTITDTSANTYSLVRNHLYGIGTRMNDDPGKGTDPDPDPDPEPTDPDQPESLNNKQELVLKVNDNWEVIHGMELD